MRSRSTEITRMRMIRLHTSNRLEILADALAEVLKRPLSSPLDREVIVVQSRGMERWICLQLAERQGVCANCRFLFPNAFVHEIFEKVLGHVPEHSPFEPEVMTWRIMKSLPALTEGSGFADLRAYLEDHRQELKLFQLSGRIADTFDQYLLFRPDMIERWERGHERHWQAVLWRELVRGAGSNHRAALAKAFFERLRALSGEVEGLPERVSVFGISALPPFYMEILSAISKSVETNLFVMNPCQEYWGTIVSPGEIENRARKRRGRTAARKELHLEKGNSLLASMGTLGRDFLENIYDFEYQEYPVFQDPGDGCLLSAIQSDILNLLDRQEMRREKKAISSDDLSIQIHSCHSPMREIEVLHDHLLAMFNGDPQMLPKDILVMTPDIEAYAPYIEAVFGATGDEKQDIPFTIADRSIRNESALGEAFLAILDLHGSRFGASQVLSILEYPDLRRRFCLSEREMDLVRKWVRETRIRWGMDEENRSHHNLPPIHENTWCAGLERLLLGYAMPGRGERLFSGVLPYDEMEGEESEALGALAEFCAQLSGRVLGLEKPRGLKAWSIDLLGLLDAFFLADEETEREVQAIRQSLVHLNDVAERSTHSRAVGFEVIREYLDHSLAQKGFGFGFMRGGVTFCAMLPMRSIPFKVICLVGMNGSAYPRQSKPLGFDLMAKRPRRGDRSRRNDDRYLFLEAILSSREKLYISYVGQDIRDNTAIQPSVLVSELMDYVESGFEVPGKDIQNHTLIKHRLQAFSPEYFRADGRLFSYSEENFKVAHALVKSRKGVAPLISTGLTEPEEAWKTVQLEGLCDFFTNPSRYLLEKRLGIHLEGKSLALEEREAFDLTGLDRYLLEENLLQKRLSGADLKSYLAPVRASGQLPHGTVGQCVYDMMREGVEHFAEKIESLRSAGELDPLHVDLSLSGFRLMGKLKGLFPGRMLRYRYSRLKARDYIRAWIHHLFLNCHRAPGYPGMTVVAGLDPNEKERLSWSSWEYEPLENSPEILSNLLEKYWAGLKMPLPLFPESSWAYASATLKQSRPPQEGLVRARRTYEGTDFSRGEGEDPYYGVCFRDKDPMNGAFVKIAEEVFAPILEHMKEAGEQGRGDQAKEYS
jgi:exodeoxyribonuclease V gamma subunit